jgi:hypothetical protein
MKRAVAPALAGLALAASGLWLLPGGGDVLAAPPTDGWTQRSWTYTLHKPWDVPASQRFRFDGTVYSLWILRGDKPFQPPPKTGGPRCELRWNNNYDSGRRMWDGDIFVVRGTTSTVVQVFGGVTHATASQIRSHADGTLRRYDSAVIHSNAFERWVNIKIAHEARAGGTGTVRIYGNDVLKSTEPDRGPKTHYFKNGVYGCGVARCEARFRNLKQWVR